MQRNDPCPCGSQKKYKKCCGFKEQAKKQMKAKVLLPGASLPGTPTTSLANRLFTVMKKAPDVQKAQENQASAAIPS